MNLPLRNFTGADLRILLVTRSMIVPRGQIQPQKNLPRMAEARIIMIPGTRSMVIALTARI